MNHNSDKEMELLLRRHARRSTSGLAEEGAARQDAAHMDADELGAYAEGALPEAARSRYALHLADCDSCRRIVTELVLSSGIETEERGNVAQTVETPARSWREWFAALISPPALRYAAPALALVAFASIVFVVITRNREIPSLVTQQGRDAGRAANRDMKQQNDDGAIPYTGTSNSADYNHGSPSSANANVEGTSSAPRASQGPGESNTETAPARETGQASPADAPKTVDGTVNAPPPAIQENAAEAKQPSQSLSSADKSSERVKEKENALLVDQRRPESSDSAGGGAPAPGATSGRAGRSTEPARRGALGASSASTSEERQQKSEAQRNAPATASRARRDTSGADEEYSNTATRTVAGKRFRQQSGVWVDTSYNSSRSTIRVRRGSEQYRALVADEPVIGAVANSLSGNVIVVAGGRAYHIY